MKILITAFLALVFCLMPGLMAEEVADYTTEWNTKCRDYLAEWKKPGGPANKELTANLLEAAVKSEHPEIVEEVAAGGDLAGKEIKLPDEVKTVPLTLVRNLGEAPKTDSSYPSPWVIRRMTDTHFEVWLPTHGWLFDQKGRLVNEAVPRRRDGNGREWYGAFLPDGRWVTTDLWEMDRTLHFFSAKGKWVKDLSSTQLAPRDPKDAGNGDYTEPDLLGWCRCDREGKGFVVSIGANGGRAIVFVPAQGKPRLLIEASEPWQLCQPRELEPKGMYTTLKRPSDDSQGFIYFGEAGHGTWVGYPHYQWGGEDSGSICIPNGDNNFGFMPGSRDVFIGATNEVFEENNNDEDHPPKRDLKTWFFSEKGGCRGWLRGSYLTDAEQGKNTWYLDEKNSVTLLDRELQPVARLQFTLKDSPIIPEKLFPDLHLGLFRDGKRMILARWE